MNRPKTLSSYNFLRNVYRDVFSRMIAYVLDDNESLRSHQIL